MGLDLSVFAFSLLSLARLRASGLSLSLRAGGDVHQHRGQLRSAYLPRSRRCWRLGRTFLCFLSGLHGARRVCTVARHRPVLLDPRVLTDTCLQTFDIGKKTLTAQDTFAASRDALYASNGQRSQASSGWLPCSRLVPPRSPPSPQPKFTDRPSDPDSPSYPSPARLQTPKSPTEIP